MVREGRPGRGVSAFRWRDWAAVLLLAAAFLTHRHGAGEWAYIGPGAGFAFLGSFLTFLLGIFLGLISLLLWPFRLVWGFIRGHRE